LDTCLREIKMADSKDKIKSESTDDFSDDLDAMLNDAGASIEDGGEIVDDEDVIDRLLMDDSFDPTEETGNDEEIYSNIEKGSTDNMAEKQQQSTSGEFDEDDLIDSVSVDKEEIDEFADEDEFDVDSLLSSAAEEMSEEVEVEGSDETQAANSSEDEKAKESEEEFDIDDLIDSTADTDGGGLEVEEGEDDFLMADFDISADGGDVVESSEAEEPEGIEIDEPVIELDTVPSTIDKEASLEFKNELNAQKIEITKVTDDLAEAIKAVNELSKQLNQVATENETLKGSIAELAAATGEKNISAEEEIDGLQKDQRKLRKIVKEAESNVPVVVYITLGIAILALLLGSGFGFIGYAAKTDVESLAELVSTLEEEIEIITTKDSTADIRELNFKINELKIKDEGIDEQLLGLLKEMQQPKSNSLQKVVDDLVVQNNHAQKAIEKLLAAVETLEHKVVLTAAARKRALQARKAAAKVEWAVNLVSFKQEWYAKRKADEFKKKGIPAKVEQVKVNGEKWFRLRVKGFKSKYEAAAYAVKVKKILNLSSVWVTKV